MNRCTRIGAHDGQPITVCKGEDAQTIIIIKDVHVSTRRGRTKKRGKKEEKEGKRGKKEEKKRGRTEGLDCAVKTGHGRGKEVGRSGWVG